MLGFLTVEFSSVSAGFGWVSAGALLLFGLYATLKSRGFAFRALPAAFRQIARPEQGKNRVSPFQAFATSLAGTIGVGNLTGVAVAVSLGGAGAVFWMWVSALLCMAVKYDEIRLALRHQPKEETAYAFAPMVYLREATGGKGLCGLFALSGLACALSMGNMIQTNAAADALNEAFGLPPLVCGVLFAAGAAALLTGGIRRIARALERTIPLFGVLFLLVGIAVILLRADRIPAAFGAIFRGAFSGQSVTGGLFGSAAASAIRYGVGNGLFSHEAGLGSAGLAHGTCGADPDRQGLWGIFEVFADTIVISTVSALMILVSGVGGADRSVGNAAGAVLGSAGNGIVALCLTAFAFLSLLSWSCYGETCFVWLCGRKSAVFYRIIFLAAPLFGVLAPQAQLWTAAEIINGLMLIFHLPGLIAFRADLKQIGRLRARDL